MKVASLKAFKLRSSLLEAVSVFATAHWSLVRGTACCRLPEQPEGEGSQPACSGPLRRRIPGCEKERRGFLMETPLLLLASHVLLDRIIGDRCTAASRNVSELTELGSCHC